MKTHLNLGLAFRDAYGTLVVNLQLVETGRTVAIGIADYHNGVCTRFLFSDKACARSFPVARKAQFRTQSAECASLKAVKSLEWAYPSSVTAGAFGFDRAGCWTVQLGLPCEPWHAVRAFAENQFDYALDVARGLPFEWSPIVLRNHPDYAAPVSA